MPQPLWAPLLVFNFFPRITFFQHTSNSSHLLQNNHLERQAGFKLNILIFKSSYVVDLSIISVVYI